MVNRQLGIRRSALNSARDVALSFLHEGPADDRLRALAPGDRGARHLPQGGARDEAGLRGRSSAATAAATCRSSGARSSAACATARCSASSRPTRSSSGSTSAASTSSVLVGYPGTRRLDLAAGRARRAPQRHVRGGAGRQLDAAQPVHRQAPRLLLRRAGRAGPHQPRQPADPRQPRQVRGLRAALRRRRALRPREPASRSSQYLEDEKLLHRAGERWHWTSESYPADAVSLRSRLLRQLRDPGRHARAAHHRRGRLRLGARRWSTRRPSTSSRAAPTSSRSTTTTSGACTCARPRSTTTPTRSPTRRCGSSSASPRSRAANARRNHGEVHVTSQVVGFKKIKFHTNENVGSGELTMPENEMHTTVVLADRAARDHARAAVLARGAARRRRGALVHARPAGGAVPDVRPPRPRAWPSATTARARRTSSAACGGCGRAAQRRAAAGRGLRAERLRLRQLPRRDRALRAALPAARQAARREPRADRGLPLRRRLPVLRRARRARSAAAARKWPWRSSTRCWRSEPFLSWGDAVPHAGALARRRPGPTGHDVEPPRSAAAAEKPRAGGCPRHSSGSRTEVLGDLLPTTGRKCSRSSSGSRGSSRSPR